MVTLSAGGGGGGGGRDGGLDAVIDRPLVNIGCTGQVGGADCMPLYRRPTRSPVRPPDTEPRLSAWPTDQPSD